MVAGGHFGFGPPRRVCPHFHNRQPSFFFFNSNFIDDKSIEKTISTLNGHGIVGDDPTNIQELTTGLVLQTMDLYVHRRKWSLTIHGLKGEAGGDEEVTRDAGVKPAKIIFVSPRLPQPILWLVTTSASRQAAAL